MHFIFMGLYLSVLQYWFVLNEDSAYYAWFNVLRLFLIVNMIQFYREINICNSLLSYHLRILGMLLFILRVYGETLLNYKFNETTTRNFSVLLQQIFIFLELFVYSNVIYICLHKLHNWDENQFDWMLVYQTANLLS